MPLLFLDRSSSLSSANFLQRILNLSFGPSRWIIGIGKVSVGVPLFSAILQNQVEQWDASRTNLKGSPTSLEVTTVDLAILYFRSEAEAYKKILVVS